MNEVDLRKAQARAAKANKIFNDKLVQEVFSEMDKDLFKLWKMSVAEDTEGRERAYLVMRGGEIFKELFHAYLKAGKLAQHELEQIMKRETAKWQSSR